MTTAEALTKIKTLIGFNAPPVAPPIAPLAPPVAAPVTLTTDYVLADGTTVSIDKLEVGGMVTIAAAPAPDGVILLADGTSITVAGGVITAITLPVAPEAPLETVAQMKAAVQKFTIDNPNQKSIGTILNALVESVFGYEIDKAKAAEVVAIYQEGFAKQKEALTGLVELVETISKTAVEAPLDSEKDFAEMTPLEKFRAVKTKK